MKAKDFKKLQEEWYQKLEESGFEDAEHKSKPLQQVFSIDAVQGKIRDLLYTNHCRDILKVHKFDGPTEELIFQKHTEGMTEREIQKYIQTNIVELNQNSKYSIKSLTRSQINREIDQVLKQYPHYRGEKCAAQNAQKPAVTIIRRRPNTEKKET